MCKQLIKKTPQISKKNEEKLEDFKGRKRGREWCDYLIISKDKIIFEILPAPKEPCSIPFFHQIPALFTPFASGPLDDNPQVQETGLLLTYNQHANRWTYSHRHITRASCTGIFQSSWADTSLTILEMSALQWYHLQQWHYETVIVSPSRSNTLSCTYNRILITHKAEWDSGT